MEEMDPPPQAGETDWLSGKEIEANVGQPTVAELNRVFQFTRSLLTAAAIVARTAEGYMAETEEGHGDPAAIETLYVSLMNCGLGRLIQVEQEFNFPTDSTYPFWRVKAFVKKTNSVLGRAPVVAGDMTCTSAFDAVWAISRQINDSWLPPFDKPKEPAGELKRIVSWLRSPSGVSSSAMENLDAVIQMELPAAINRLETETARNAEPGDGADRFKGVGLSFQMLCIIRASIKAGCSLIGEALLTKADLPVNSNNKTILAQMAEMDLLEKQIGGGYTVTEAARRLEKYASSRGEQPSPQKDERTSS